MDPGFDDSKCMLVLFGSIGFGYVTNLDPYHPFKVPYSMNKAVRHKGQPVLRPQWLHHVHRLSSPPRGFFFFWGTKKYIIYRSTYNSVENQNLHHTAIVYWSWHVPMGNRNVKSEPKPLANGIYFFREQRSISTDLHITGWRIRIFTIEGWVTVYWHVPMGNRNLKPSL